MTNAVFSETIGGRFVELFVSCRTSSDWYTTDCLGRFYSDHEPSREAAIAAGIAKARKGVICLTV